MSVIEKNFALKMLNFDKCNKSKLNLKQQVTDPIYSAAAWNS